MGHLQPGAVGDDDGHRGAAQGEVDRPEPRCIIARINQDRPGQQQPVGGVEGRFPVPHQRLHARPEMRTDPQRCPRTGCPCSIAMKRDIRQVRQQQQRCKPGRGRAGRPLQSVPLMHAAARQRTPPGLDPPCCADLRGGLHSPDPLPQLLQVHTGAGLWSRCPHISDDRYLYGSVKGRVEALPGRIPHRGAEAPRGDRWRACSQAWKRAASSESLRLRASGATGSR